MNHAGEGAGPVVHACDVFLSYARGDRPRAAALAKALEHRGLQVWWDRELGAGDLWARKIEEAVETARSVVVLWSSESVQSRWVSAEARVGLDHEKLVPVCLEDCEPPLVFREVQWRSFAGWDGEGEPPGIEDLVGDIQAAIQRAGGTVVRRRPRRRWAWGRIAAAVLGLGLGGAAVGFDLWGATLEAATDVVVRSGFPLPPLAMQVAAVGLAVLYLTRYRSRVWPLRAASAARVLTCALVLALGLGVLYDWIQQSRNLQTYYIEGHIQADDLHCLQVRVLDSLARDMAAASPVGDDNGNFVLPVKPVFGDRPRRLVIEVDRKECAEQRQCASETVAIGRREARSKGDLEEPFPFTCRRQR